MELNIADQQTRELVDLCRDSYKDLLSDLKYPVTLSRDALEYMLLAASLRGTVIGTHSVVAGVHAQALINRNKSGRS